MLFLFTQAFLWMGMWLLFTTPTAHAGRMALLGIVAGLATPGPNLGSLNGFRDHIEVAGEVLFLILFFLGYIVASALAVVHAAAVLPREGRASPGMGPVLAGWRWRCARELGPAIWEH